MDNFLDLCQWVQPRIGYSGNWTSIADAKADLAKIVSHVQESESRLCSLYQDWEFLKVEEEQALVIGQAEYEPPADLGNYRRSPWPAVLDGTEAFLAVVPLLKALSMPSSSPDGRPVAAILNPDRTFRLWPAPSMGGSVFVQYHRAPELLVADADESPIPKRFWPAVGWDAVRTLAMVESDTPLVMYATDQANRWLSQLVADQLPDHYALHYGSTEAAQGSVVRVE